MYTCTAQFNRQTRHYRCSPSKLRFQPKNFAQMAGFGSTEMKKNSCETVFFMSARIWLGYNCHTFSQQRRKEKNARANARSCHSAKCWTFDAISLPPRRLCNAPIWLGLLLPCYLQFWTIRFFFCFSNVFWHFHNKDLEMNIYTYMQNYHALRRTSKLTTRVLFSH